MEQSKENGKIITRPKYRPYDLRHFFASMLIEQRVSLKRVQYLMGHEDVRTTLNVYGHLIERVEQSLKLRVKTIDVYAPYRTSKTVPYLLGDTHWNCTGRAIWLDQVRKTARL